MTFTLLINGEPADFEATMSRIFKQAISEMSAPAAYMPEFVIEPERLYKVGDERLIKLFGANGFKHPIDFILRSLRKMHIEPMSVQRKGSLIWGHQINDYFLKLSAKQTDYLNKN